MIRIWQDHIIGCLVGLVVIVVLILSGCRTEDAHWKIRYLSMAAEIHCTDALPYIRCFDSTLIRLVNALEEKTND